MLQHPLFKELSKTGIEPAITPFVAIMIFLGAPAGAMLYFALEEYNIGVWLYFVVLGPILYIAVSLGISTYKLRNGELTRSQKRLLRKLSADDIKKSSAALTFQEGLNYSAVFTSYKFHLRKGIWPKHASITARALGTIEEDVIVMAMKKKYGGHVFKIKKEAQKLLLNTLKKDFGLMASNIIEISPLDQFQPVPEFLSALNALNPSWTSSKEFEALRSEVLIPSLVSNKGEEFNVSEAHLACELFKAIDILPIETVVESLRNEVKYITLILEKPSEYLEQPGSEFYQLEFKFSAWLRAIDLQLDLVIKVARLARKLLGPDFDLKVDTAVLLTHMLSKVELEMNREIKDVNELVAEMNRSQEKVQSEISGFAYLFVELLKKLNLFSEVGQDPIASTNALSMLYSEFKEDMVYLFIGFYSREKTEAKFPFYLTVLLNFLTDPKIYNSKLKDLLSEYVDHEFFLIRILTIQAIGKSKNKELIPFLSKALREDYRRNEELTEIINAIANIDLLSDILLEILGITQPPNPDQMEAFQNETEKMLESLEIDELKSKISIASTTDHASENKKEEPEAPPIEDHVEQNDHKTEETLSVGWSLGQIKDEIVIPLCNKLLEQKDVIVNEDLLKGLGDLRVAKNMSNFIEALENKSEYLQEIAITSLGLSGVTEAIEPLKELYSKCEKNIGKPYWEWPDIRLRWSIALALDKIGYEHNHLESLIEEYGIKGKEGNQGSWHRETAFCDACGKELQAPDGYIGIPQGYTHPSLLCERSFLGFWEHDRVLARMRAAIWWLTGSEDLGGYE